MGVIFAKRAAGSILNRGTSAIRIKPDAVSEATKALTKDDIRKLIGSGSIYAIKEKHNVSRRAKLNKKARSEGRRRGIGRRRGTDKARAGTGVWEKKVRSQRRLIKELKLMKKIDTKTFNDFYKHIKGNEYATKATVILHLREQGIVITDEELKSIKEKAAQEYR
ncbi:MAG: 50S ribosomal protein L19e domain-containing protein [Candidatus Micrarchaeaceae archaeon]